MSHEKEGNQSHIIEEKDKLNDNKLLEEEPKEIEIENLENFSNEVRVYSKSSISALLDLCEKMLSFQKIKELQLSASGRAISKLIALVEIVKSLHPYLIQNTVLTTIKEEGEEVELSERGKYSPKIEIVLSQSEPQGKIFEKMSEKKKEELIDIWESQKERENKNKIKRRPMINNNNGKVFQNNKRIGFVKKWGFGYGNKGYRWQMNGFWNVRNWKWRNYNGNWNNVDNKRIWVNY